MKIVFFGTPPFSAQILEFLIQHDQEILAVVTRPDRPKGRSQKMQSSAVKTLCEEKYPRLPLFQPEKASDEAFAATLRALEPDVFVVVAYGEIIKQNLLDIPKKLPINIHASILPKFRGAAPIQRAIMEGETETGITIMEMVLKMDAGAMLEVAKTEIGEDMTLEELEGTLCKLAGPALLHVLEKVESGTLQKIEQDESQVTFAQKISLEDRIIDWKKSCHEIHNQIRGLSPFPGAFCFIEQNGQLKRLGIKRAQKSPDLSGMAGETIAYGNGEWVVGCGKGALSLLDLQMEGKKILDIESFLRGQLAPPTLKIE